MATPSKPGDGNMFSILKEGMSAAGKRIADIELDKKLAPAVDTGKQAAQKSLEAVAKVGGQAREVVSQEKLWEEQRELVEQLIDVLTLQQGLIEDLRGRVARLEAAQ